MTGLLSTINMFLSSLITAVTVSEVEALYELFKKLSNSISKDGVIHKVYPSMEFYHLVSICKIDFGLFYGFQSLTSSCISFWAGRASACVIQEQ